MVSTIAENGYDLAYRYGQNHQRIKSVLKQVNFVLETKYQLETFEQQIKGSIILDNHYVKWEWTLCYIVKQGSNKAPYFVYSDHLGNILTIAVTSGNIVSSQNFDA